MKRTLAAIISLAAGLTVSPLTVATAAPRTCGELCVQRSYGGASLGAWFIDGSDELLLAESSGFSVVSTFTQKTTFRYAAPEGLYIESIAPSANRNFVVIALSNGVVSQYSTEDWTGIVMNGGVAIADVMTVAVSNNGDEVYVARNQRRGYYASKVQRFHQGVLAETFTNDGIDYGIFELTVDDLDANLYVGWNGYSPTFAKFDADAISAGFDAADNSDLAWSASSIEVASDGTVFGGNDSISIAGEDGVDYPHVLRMNGNTMAVTHTFDETQDWREWEIALSDDDETLFVASSFYGATEGDVNEAHRLDILNASNLEVENSLVFENLGNQPITNVDADSSGRYVVAAMADRAYIVSLDSSRITLSAEIFDMGDSGLIIDWQYSYFNSKAKFKWFEVKYYPAGKRKATVKRVKRETYAEIPTIKPGTTVKVRAVYTKKTYNTAWNTALVAIP